MDLCLLEEQLALRLEQNGVTIDEKCWTIKKSSLGGRGLFATRNIDQGELIYVDVPLLLGPKCYSKHLPLCVSCYKTDCPLFPCDRGCGLPVCSTKCENSSRHVNYECAYLSKNIPKCGSDWSMNLLSVVVPIRALFLSSEEKCLLDTFENHGDPCESPEVELLRKNVGCKLNGEDVNFMNRVSGILNTNSFETIVKHVNKQTASLRALYPLGAMQNHCCVPNTKHRFDSKQYIHMHASLPINIGEEITMSYTDLLWDTKLRRYFLNATKNFLCECRRCSDVTEFGSNLGDLFCAADNCSGVLRSVDPLNSNATSICSKCKISVTCKQIRSIRSGLAATIEEAVRKSPREILKFICNDLTQLVPAANYTVMEVKFLIISYFGRIDNLEWKDLTDSELQLKLTFCKDLLDVLNMLECGNCKKKGLILYELYFTRREIMKRVRSCDVEL